MAFASRGTLQTIALQYIVPLLCGVLIAFLASVLLAKASLVWLLLLLAGLGALALSLVVPDVQAYWLVVYLSTVIIDLKKYFGDGYLVSRQLGFLGNPSPSVVVPELHVSDIALGVLMAIWLWKLVHREATLRWPREAWLPVAYLSWSAITVLTSAEPYLGIVAWIREMKFFLVYLYVANEVNRHVLFRVVRVGLVAVLVLQSAVTLARFGLGFEDIFGSSFGRTGLVDNSEHLVVSELAGGRRAYGTTPSPRATAVHLLLLLPWAGLAALRCRGLLRFALIAVTGLGLLALMATYSRSAMATLAVTFPVWIWLSMRWGIISRRTLVSSGSMVVLLVVLVAPFAYKFLTSRPSNVTIRWYQYDTAYNMIKEHPMLGVGLNNSQLLELRYSRFSSTQPLGDMTKASHLEPIHSAHLARIAETGLVGEILYMTFLLLIWRRAAGLTGSVDPTVAFISGACLVGMLGPTIQSLTDPLFEHTNQSTLWMFAGLVTSLSWLERDAARRDAVKPARVEGER